MRILWLTRENPLHAGRGDLLYSGGLIRALADAGDQVTILSYRHGASGPPDVAGVESLSVEPTNKRRVGSLLTALPADAFRLKSDHYLKTLKKALSSDRYDVVAIDYFAMGWTVGAIEEYRATEQGKALVTMYIAHHYEQVVRPFVARSVRGNPALRAILPFDAWKATRLERSVVAAVDLITTITPPDEAAFALLAPDVRIQTLLPGYSGPVAADRPIDETVPRRVLLVGAFDWIAKRQNLLDFARAACGPFQAAGIELDVVGRADPDFAQRVKALFPQIRFTGPVADVYPYLRDARIGLMPDTIGGGFKLKYLDYIFNGVPIATIRSQAIGLPLDLDRDLIAADNPAALVGKIVAAIDDLPRLNEMRVRSLRAARNAFHWRDRGAVLHGVLEELRAARARRKAAS